MNFKPLPEVINVITTKQMIIDGWYGQIGGGQIELREGANSSWSVWYPEPGFLPCLQDCKHKHSHVRIRPMIKSYYQPTSYEDAMGFAEYLADDRPIKVYHYGDRLKEAKGGLTNDNS